MPNRPHSRNEPDPLIGKLLAGRYLVKELIDRGGMGRVYRAEQQPLGRMVALKTLDLLDPRGEFRERFFNEASVASKLTHPNTVRIFDYGRSEDGIYFLTMELLEGQSLHRVIKAEAPLAPLRLIHIARQVCGALHEAHERGIVHRDMKPGNVFLTHHGDDLEFAKVLDFGLVKDLHSDVSLSQTGQALGSPLYMSPEQVEGDPVDRRTDIYALGLVMYVALTGRVPFRKGSVATIMMQQVTATLPTFDEIAPGHSIPFSLEWVVRRCIEKKPEHRFATMAELSRALKLCAQEIRGELAEPIEWKLDKAGRLAVQPELLNSQEDTNIPPPAAVEAALQASAGQELPSSPTLNASTASRTVATAAAAGIGGLLLLGGGAALLGIGSAAAIAFYLAQPGPPPPKPAAPAVAPAPPPSAAPAPIAPPAPSFRVVSIVSTPKAEVLRDGRLLGVTPLEVKLEPGEELTLTLHADGYHDRQILADGSVASIEVPLKPKPKPKLRRDKAPPRPVKPTPTPNMTEIRDPWEDG